MQELNIGCVLMLALFTFAALFCADDLLATRLGKATLVFTALFYAARAVAEILLAPRVSPLILVACLLVALLYLPGIFASRETKTA